MKLSDFFFQKHQIIIYKPFQSDGGSFLNHLMVSRLKQWELGLIGSLFLSGCSFQSHLMVRIQLVMKFSKTVRCVGYSFPSHLVSKLLVVQLVMMMSWMIHFGECNFLILLKLGQQLDWHQSFRFGWMMTGIESLNLHQRLE